MPNSRTALGFIVMTALAAQSGSVPRVEWPVYELSAEESARRYPFYQYVPKDYDENLEFRKQLILWACESQDHIQELWIACSRDLLFYINTFAYIFEPRTGETHPFITWPFQDAVLTEIKDAIGDHDLILEKSRDMGASWMAVTVFQWEFEFHEGQTFLMMSRKQDLVDSAEADPDALYTKLDFIRKHLPGWLRRPHATRTDMHLGDESVNNSIDGESTNEYAATGGRRKAILIDEFSKMKPHIQKTLLTGTRDVTYCRIFTFTPQGTANTAFDIAHNPEFRKLTLHWTLHPQKRIGLYYDKDGKPRSPWYDGECKRANGPMEIAQELDISYLGSDSAFFYGVDFPALVREFCRPPVIIGDVRWSDDALFEELVQRPDGKWSFWVPIQGVRGKPPPGDYVLAADIAAGTGSSNTVFSIGNRTTHEKVAEYANAHIMPHDAARLAVAVAKWFYNAKIIWDNNGPCGRTFTATLMDTHYGNLYWRQAMSHESARRKPTLKPGFWTGKKERQELLGDYRRALSERTFINRSRLALKECDDILQRPDGSIVNSKARKCEEAGDASGAGDSHADRVTADALLNYQFDKEKPGLTPKVGPVVSMNTLLGRRQYQEQRLRAKTYY